MYDITKLKELASMFHVEVDLWGTEQDRLTMSGKTSDINKFWEAAERQGLLSKDPFDESYNPEETSWMDDLIDILRAYPSNDKIENDAFLKELRELYYKHYPDSDKIIEELDEEPKYWCVDGADDRVHVGYTSKEAAWQRGLDYYHGDSTQFSVYPEPDDDREDDEDYWNKIMVQEYHGEETLMEKFDFDALYKKIKYQEDMPMKEGLIGTLLFDTKFAHDLYTEFYQPLIVAIKSGRKAEAQQFYDECVRDFSELEGKRYAKTFLAVQKDLLAKYKEQIDAMEDVKIEDPALVEDVNSDTRNITIGGVEDREECPYLLGEDSTQCEIANRYDLTEDELWCTGWIGAVQNCNAGPFNSFDELDIYCYDREKGVEYDLPEIPEDIKTKFLAEVNKYIEEVGTIEEGYKPHTKRLLKLIGSDKLEEVCDSNINVHSKEEYDDYEDSYTPISEDIDDEYHSNHKAENVEFVMNEYITDEFGVESIIKVNDTTYKVIYDGTEVEIVFDFSWDEWVYTINRKGPFSHSSYEWLISDIRTVLAQEPIQESYFEDEPSWLDDEDPVDADREHANLYGGDRTYCDTCGSKLAMDEWGSYCPKCSQEDPLDDTIEELHESGFDTHSDIDLDMVGTRVANLLDEDNLGDDWIEFDCKDSRGLIGTSDLHMSFEATGSDKVLRGYMRAHTDDTIDVYITNGSEGKFRSPREIARFIAGEFGLFNYNI